VQTSEANYTHKMTTQDLNGLRLYLITDRSLFDGGKEFLDAVDAALMGGVKTIS